MLDKCMIDKRLFGVTFFITFRATKVQKFFQIAHNPRIICHPERQKNKNLNFHKFLDAYFCLDFSGFFNIFLHCFLHDLIFTGFWMHIFDMIF